MEFLLEGNKHWREYQLKFSNSDKYRIVWLLSAIQSCCLWNLMGYKGQCDPC